MLPLLLLLTAAAEVTTTAATTTTAAATADTPAAEVTTTTAATPITATTAETEFTTTTYTAAVQQKGGKGNRSKRSKTASTPDEQPTTVEAETTTRLTRLDVFYNELVTSETITNQTEILSIITASGLDVRNPIFGETKMRKDELMNLLVNATVEVQNARNNVKTAKGKHIALNKETQKQANIFRNYLANIIKQPAVVDAVAALPRIRRFGEE